MASIAEAIKSLNIIPSIGTAMSNSVIGSVAGGAQTVTKTQAAIETVADKITSGEIEAKVDKALSLAEVWVAVSTGAQILAAFAAVGIFMVQVRAYEDGKKHRRPVSINPRRRRRR